MSVKLSKAENVTIFVKLVGGFTKRPLSSWSKGNALSHFVVGFSRFFFSVDTEVKEDTCYDMSNSEQQLRSVLKIGNIKPIFIVK